MEQKEIFIFVRAHEREQSTAISNIIANKLEELGIFSGIVKYGYNPDEIKVFLKKDISLDLADKLLFEIENKVYTINENAVISIEIP